MKTLTDIRSTFLDFFEENNHKRISSSPLVPNNDPTLLFTNAGMVQFKDVFTGLEKTPYHRATTAQKCLRAGGKHNDLENVGYTARHHTFFEMLGNFSFGDYFKEEAIYFAWSLLTKEFGLSPDRLLVTVYHDDDEAEGLWKKIAGFSDEKIIRIPTADNFWSMGDTGPCGPCTEIFYDHGDHIQGGPPGSPEEDGDRFIEIWNLVFMQYEQLGNGSRIHLPKPSVDTGMGIERIASVLQGVYNNFETDLFRHLIDHSVSLIGGDPHAHSHRVIADHLRACSFLLADGVLPSNEGRGYVLRRIMRRGMRHAHLLGAKEPLMHRLVHTLVEMMGAAYPELERAEDIIVQNLRLEEEKFRETLGRGLKLLQQETAIIAPGEPLSGDIAFKLYDTYGFPLDLTQDVLKSEGRDVDVEAFNAAMENQKAAARAAWSGSGDAKNEQVWYDLADTYGATEFLGYETLTAEALVLGIVNEDTAPIENATDGQTVFILTNQTPFYAESGGQIGDTGLIQTAGLVIDVSQTIKKLGKLFVHVGVVREGTVKVGQAVTLVVDEERRLAIKRNHSATHLLHAALRSALGNHVTQKGSLVAPDRLRFDFTHTAALSAAQIAAVEDMVNTQILSNTPVKTAVMTPDAAITAGAMALFGERYGEEVRVLSMGKNNDPFSVELCGGTHVNQTGDIGCFKILTESSVSSGVRRIEAITGNGIADYIRQLEDVLQSSARLLKVNKFDVCTKIEALLAEKKNLARAAVNAKNTGAENVKISTLGRYRFAHHHLTDSSENLKGVADHLKTQLNEGVALVTSTAEDGRVSVVVGVTEALSKELSAVDMIRLVVPILGGKGGGGRADLAQGGGQSASSLPEAIKQLEAFIASR